MKEVTPEELAKFNGREENPGYVAHQGRIFDVTGSRMWKGGLHMSIHHAGEDLTDAILAAPHGPEVLARLPQVALLGKEKAQRALPDRLSRLLMRFPVLRRHPHPMTVHFPIVFMVAAPLFTLLYLLSGQESFEITALHCLGAGLLFTPLAMATGYFTWWVNYLARPLRPVTIKQRISLLLFGIEIIAFSWRLHVPDILSTFRPESILYLALILSLFPLVGVIGWFGATLTFPIARD